MTKKFRRIYMSLLKFIPQRLRFSLIRNLINVKYELPKELTLKVAETPEELQQAFELLYETYLERDYINKNEEKLRVTKYHALPCTTMIIAKWNNEVIGTISYVVDSSLGLPLEELWDLSGFRSKGYRIAEISAFGIKRHSQMEKRDLIFPLFRTMVQYSINCNAVDIFVLATTLRVKDFYAACFGALPIDNKVKKYNFVKGTKAFAQYINAKPSQLKGWGQTTYQDKKDHKNIHKYVYGPSIDQWTQLPERKYIKGTDTALTPELLDRFFGRTGILGSLNREEAQIFHNLYPYRQFKGVLDRHIPFANKISRKYARHFSCCSGRFINPENLKITTFRTTDVSLDGLSIQTRESLQEGQKLNLQITVGPRRYAKVKAILTWRGRNNNYGLRIIESDQSEWCDYINYLEKDIQNTSNCSSFEEKAQ